jgi:hypothetical protein
MLLSITSPASHVPKVRWRPIQARPDASLPRLPCESRSRRFVNRPRELFSEGYGISVFSWGTDTDKMTKLEMVMAAIQKLQEASALLQSAGMSDESQQADDLAAEVNAHSASLQE